jgi:thymidylate kinase
VLISFAGLDGAGKSTLIAWLKSLLEERNRQVAVFHMNKDVGIYAYARALQDRLQNMIHERRPVAVPAGGNGGETGERSAAR